MKKKTKEIIAKELDATYAHAQKYLHFSASELGWAYLGKHFVEYEKGKLSRARMCEIIMNFIWKKHHGLWTKHAII